MSHGDYKDFFYAARNGDLELVRHHLRTGIDVVFIHPEIMSTAQVAAIDAQSAATSPSCSSSTARIPRSGLRWRGGGRRLRQRVRGCLNSIARRRPPLSDHSA